MNETKHSLIVRRDRARFLTHLTESSLSLLGALVADSVQDWLIQLLRYPDKPYSFRTEVRYSEFSELTEVIDGLIEADMKYVFFAYEIEERPAFLLSGHEIKKVLRQAPLVISSDGCVICDRHASRSITIDYRTVRGDRVIGEVYCAFGGDWALRFLEPAGCGS